MAKGEFAALRLMNKRKRERLLKKSWKRKKFKLKQKYDAVGCVPMAKATRAPEVRAAAEAAAQRPNQDVKVQLIKNGKVVGAYVPYDGAINFIDEHDEVLIQGLGGSQRGQMGCIPGLKYRVIAVNGADLFQVTKGKKEKPKR